MTDKEYLESLPNACLDEFEIGEAENPSRIVGLFFYDRTRPFGEHSFGAFGKVGETPEETFEELWTRLRQWFDANDGLAHVTAVRERRACPETCGVCDDIVANHENPKDNRELAVSGA